MMTNVEVSMMENENTLAISYLITLMKYNISVENLLSTNQRWTPNVSPSNCSVNFNTTDLRSCHIFPCSNSNRIVTLQENIIYSYLRAIWTDSFFIYTLTVINTELRTIKPTNSFYAIFFSLDIISILIKTPQTLYWRLSFCRWYTKRHGI